MQSGEELTNLEWDSDAEKMATRTPIWCSTNHLDDNTAQSIEDN